MSTELARRAAAGDTGPEVARWWCEAMRRHRDGADLAQALRLDRASRLRECHQALRDADTLLTAGAPLSRSRRAKRLEAAIKRYVARIAPLYARDPSMTLSPIDEALCRAFAAGNGLRVATTDRNLFELIR